MSIILALETATDACSCALQKNGVVTEIFEIVPQRHADIILIQIEQLIAQANIRLSDVDAVAFGSGPGGFMGVRIATGVAQGLGFALNRPLIPVSTLQSLAQTAYEATQAPKVVAGWDAKMSAIYWGAYALDEKTQLMESVLTDRLTFPAEVSLPAEYQWLAAGNAWTVYEQDLPWKLSEHFIATRSDLHPHAAAIAKIATDRFNKGQTLSPEQAEPTYLRNEIAQKPKKP